MAEFPDFLKYCNLHHGKLLILGDFNIYFDSPSHPNRARVLDIFETFNMEQAVSELTHQRGHILDWALYREEEHMLCSCVVKQSTSSNYLPVLCHLSVTCPPQQHIFQIIRNNCAVDRQVFKADVAASITAFDCLTS